MSYLGLVFVMMLSGHKNGIRPAGRIGCFFGMPLIEYIKSI